MSQHLVPSAATERFAARTAGMTASEIRALFAVASRPEVVSLAGGMPNLAALPMDALAAEVADLVAREGQVALQYGSAQGRPRAARADLRGDGAGGHPAPIPTTSSSPSARRWRWTSSRASTATQAMSCSRRVRPMSARSAASPRTRRGWCTSRWTRTAWSRRCCGRRARARVRPRPKFLYTVPTFHNPAGVTLSVERRAEVLAICREYGVAVVEDNPYGLLGFSGHTYPRVALARPRRRLPGLVLQDVRGRACGWAGRSCHPPCATGSCSPPNRRPSARRVSPRCWSRATWRPTTGAARSRRTPRPTATAATPCSARWRPTSRPVARGTSPMAASTCG